MEESVGIIKRLITEENRNLKKLLDSINSIEKLKRNPLSNLHQIKQEVDKIDKILERIILNDTLKKEVNQYIKDIKSKIPQWIESKKKKFGQELENELRKAKFELRGNYPLLKVSFYTLELDFNNLEVSLWYGPKQEKLDTCKLIPGEVVKKLKQEHNRITKRPFDSDKFLSHLFEAYKISVCRKNKKFGDNIPILDVLFEYTFLIQDKKFRTNPLENNYKEYGRVFFSYDLYRLKKVKKRKINNTELDLITASRAYTKRRSDFLWVLSKENGDGTVISHIKFREVR